jgi:hypothetical protein
MNIDEMGGNSRFLKKEDCEPPITVTIDHLQKENVARIGETPELKWCLFFRDGVKPMVLNSTNRQLIARILGSKETDDWRGRKIELYHDPNVTFGGELVGGIRARKAPVKMMRMKPVEDEEPVEVDL